MPAAKTTRKAGSATTKKASKTAAKTAKKVTIDDVWAGFARLEKLHKETEKAIKETQEAHRETEKTIDRLGVKVDRLADNVGGLNRSVGELIEILIAAHLWEKFPEYDLKRVFRRIRLYDENTNEEKAEVDLLLVNSEWAMAVEVKAELDPKDVERHIERMKRILKYPPAELKIRPGIKLLGACAGGIVTPEGRAAAHDAGFFVLELTGDSVTHIPEPAGFKPKEW
jgi:predicted AAA+ superfamily ATPase